MELIFDGAWVTDYFRKRWVLEREEQVIKDLMYMIMGLNREQAVAILSGSKKIQTNIYGCFIVADNATEIDGLALLEE